jgi:hypothetical protein
MSDASSTPRGYSTGRSDSRSWRRSRPRTKTLEATTGHGTPAVHAALTSGFKIAFLVAGAFAAVGGLVAVVALPHLRPAAPELAGELAIEHSV